MRICSMCSGLIKRCIIFTTSFYLTESLIDTSRSWLWFDVPSAAKVIPVAALCNAHAFESAHPQPCIIADTLPTCRFEVNFLHINPIVGQIWLIYIHFHQKFPYFSNYVTFYCAEICLPKAYFTSSRYILKRGFPKFGLFFSKHPASFHCRKCPFPTFANIWLHYPWALESAAPVIRQAL